MKLRKIRRSVRIVRTVRTENGFTARTNRTVLEKDLRIVDTAFQSVKESVCVQVKLGKIHLSVRIVQIGRIVQIVRIVRTENGFTGRTNRTVREKDLRIVNTVFNR